MALYRPDARRLSRGGEPAAGLAAVPRSAAACGRAGAARARHRVVRQRRELPRRARLDHRRPGGADDARHRHALRARRGARARSGFSRSRCSAPRSALPPSTSTRRRCFSATPAACRSGSARLHADLCGGNRPRRGAALALYTIADSTITLFRRILNRERIFSAPPLAFLSARRDRRHDGAASDGAGVSPCGSCSSGSAIAAVIARSLAVDLLCARAWRACDRLVLYAWPEAAK